MDLMGNARQLIDGISTGALGDGEKIQMDKETVSRYRNMITNAETSHKKKFYKEAKRFLDYYRSLPGKTLNKGADDAYNVFCNDFWVNTNVQVPNLFFNNPVAAISSEQDMVDINMGVDMLTGVPNIIQVPGSEIASLLENIVNTYYEVINMKKLGRRATLGACITGRGIAKFGWQTDINGSESDNLQLTKDEMTACAFNPLNFLVDPECTDPDLEDAKYIIFRYIKPTELIKKSPLYKGVNNLKGSSELKFSGTDDDGMAKDPEYFGNMKDLERNKLYEIWDIVNKRVVVFADKLDYPIRDSEWLWDIKGYPCNVLMFNEDIEEFDPIPDFRAIEGTVLLKTKLRRKMWELFSKLNRQYVYDADILTKESELQNMIDSPTGGLTGVHAKGRSIDSVIKPLNDFVLNDSYFSLSQIADSDIERMSGISDFQRGLMSEVKRTATEMLNLSSVQNLRVDFKKQQIVDFMEKNTQLMIELLQCCADQSKQQKVKQDSQVIFAAWDKDKIQGKYSVRIDISSMAKQNPEIKQKQALERHAMFQGDPLVDAVWLDKETLKATGVTNPDEALNQEQVQAYKIMNSLSPEEQAATQGGNQAGGQVGGQMPPAQEQGPTSPFGITKEQTVG